MHPRQYTVAQIYARLNAMIREREDTGFRVAISATLLDSANPFEPSRKRRPKSIVTLAVVGAGALALIFMYFSLHAGR